MGARVEGGEVDGGPAEEEERNKVCEMRLGMLRRVLMLVWGVNLRLPKEQSKRVADGGREPPPVHATATLHGSIAVMHTWPSCC